MKSWAYFRVELYLTDSPFDRMADAGRKRRGRKLEGGMQMMGDECTTGVLVHVRGDSKPRRGVASSLVCHLGEWPVKGNSQGKAVVEVEAGQKGLDLCGVSQFEAGVLLWGSSQIDDLRQPFGTV